MVECLCWDFALSRIFKVQAIALHRPRCSSSGDGFLRPTITGIILHRKTGFVNMHLSHCLDFSGPWGIFHIFPVSGPYAYRIAQIVSNSQDHIGTGRDVSTFSCEPSHSNCRLYWLLQQQKNSSQNKMDASRKIPGSIHDAKLIVQFYRLCPENWVHIILALEAPL